MKEPVIPPMRIMLKKRWRILQITFWKFLKMKNNGKSFGKGKFSSPKNDKRDSRKKDGKDSSSFQGILCYECNDHGHLKKESPNYLRGKGKVLTTTLSDSESSNFDAGGEYDSDGNYSSFMVITTVDSRDELSDLVKELGVHSEGEEIEVFDDEDVYLNEDYGKYAKVAKSAVKKMKKIEEDHKSTLVQLKDAKYEVEKLKEELLNAYSKIKFLELEVIQANVKVECITTKKLDSMLSSQKPSTDKTILGYMGEGSSSGKPKKEMEFVLAKNLEKPKVEIPTVEKKDISQKPKAKGKSLPKNQSGPQVKYFCHHYGVRGHIRPNCFKLHAVKRADFLHDQGNSRRMPRGNQAKGENEGQLIGDVMEMLKNISSCLASFIPMFESYVGRTFPSKYLTQNTRAVCVKNGTHA
ncbi:uncharacterized protein LOC111997132 [Quercus suber]|uniref:uncharacterized protein LOC111997132 n=1 Tax=Quercus suber TaxID=58331 RepID=UPI000CE1C207|nr:uncharacterized protein LOC111997132 [Quercus suber]